MLNRWIHQAEATRRRYIRLTKNEGASKVPEDTTWRDQVTSKIKDVASGTASAVKGTSQIPINESKRVWMDRVVSIAKYESDNMSVNNAKMVKASIERYVDFTKSVPLSELGLETPNTKAPLFFVPERLHQRKTINFMSVWTADVVLPRIHSKQNWRGQKTE